MNKNLEAWCIRLETGTHGQARGTLASGPLIPSNQLPQVPQLVPTMFCCLGVGCQVMGEDDNINACWSPTGLDRDVWTAKGMMTQSSEFQFKLVGETETTNVAFPPPSFSVWIGKPRWIANNLPRSHRSIEAASSARAILLANPIEGLVLPEGFKNRTFEGVLNIFAYLNDQRIPHPIIAKVIRLLDKEGV